MQGYVISTERDRSLILGDDGGRYTFSSLEWQNDNMQPEVGMRVDFEVQDSGAVEIYPIPVASPTPTIESSSASSTLPGASPAQPPLDKRLEAIVHQAHNELDTHYTPIRKTIGNYGVIAVGIALLALGSFIRFDVLLGLIGEVGMIVGVAIAAVGVFMLGKEKGWWYRSGEPGGQVGYAPPSPGNASKPPAEIERIEQTTSEGGEVRVAGAPGTARRMKSCPNCRRTIRYAAIKCRYCRSDIPSEVDSS
jgi:hypothetical protein